MHLPVPKKREDIKQIVQEMIRENELPNSGIRLQLTGGDYTEGSAFTSPTFFISQIEFPLPSPSMRENGIRLVSYGHQRQLPEVKSTDYLMSIWLQPFLKDQHADDILYANDVVTECPRSNFFIVTNDLRVITPSNRILKGITRMKLMQLASGICELEERDLTLDEIFNAKEAFITSTTKQVIAVSSIDGKKIGNGLPGEVTKMLSNKLNEYCGLNL
jgi:D-alanine transaminase/branched-chain amino acid aminotransferase